MVEFILVMPFMIILTLGAIELAVVYMTYSSMMDGARDAARQLARGATTAEAETLARSRMMFDHNYTITARDPAPSSADDVSVTITLPVAEATATNTLPITVPDLQVTVTMRKEA